MKKLLFIGVLLIISCKESNAPVDSDTQIGMIYTVAPDMNHWSKDSLGNWTDSPQFGYYGDKNIIVDEEGRLFYYSYDKKYSMDCIDYDSLPPIPLQEIIDLKPSDIIEFNKNIAADFTELNINKFKNPYYTTLAIGTAKDMFTSSTLDVILSKLLYEKVVYMIRPMTEEEKIVLAHYKNGKPYYSSNVVWDTLKVDAKSIK